MRSCWISGVTSTALTNCIRAASRWPAASSAFPAAIARARDAARCASVPSLDGKLAPSNTTKGTTPYRISSSTRSMQYLTWRVVELGPAVQSSVAHPTIPWCSLRSKARTAHLRQVSSTHSIRALSAAKALPQTPLCALLAGMRRSWARRRRPERAPQLTTPAHPPPECALRILKRARAGRAPAAPQGAP